MIIATLLVMVAITYIFFDYQRDNRETLAKTQGLDLVRLLGGMSWDELIPANGRKGFLEVLNRGQSNPDFAYGAVVDMDGNFATEVTRSGVIIPVGSLPTEPATWIGQRKPYGVQKACHLKKPSRQMLLNSSPAILMIC